MNWIRSEEMSMVVSAPRGWRGTSRVRGADVSASSRAASFSTVGASNSTWRGIVPFGLLGGLQGLAVDLSVGGQRQPVQDDDPVGQHVAGQQPGQVLLDQLGRALHVDHVLLHVLTAQLLVADPPVDEEVRGSRGQSAVGEDPVEPLGRGQVVAGPGAVAGGHEAEVQVVHLQALQGAAQVEVTPPGVGAGRDEADGEAGALVDPLVDGDDVFLEDDVVADADERAVGVPVLAGREAVDAAGVGLHVDVEGVRVADGVPGPQLERAQVVVLLGAVEAVLDGRTVLRGPEAEAVGRQYLLEQGGSTGEPERRVPGQPIWRLRPASRPAPIWTRVSTMMKTSGTRQPSLRS
ncbi:hypothetical protein [Streptomyces sp. ME18-1-4]|uniref:hypothetical protein n=1 Tax=Streptomyces sp. ME18-1-4 TaxID=3028685 RepID=UPI0029A54A4F|nr:hypothetical protein [Streptomyces sp. ME18-1-4]MDX3243765.1 hypothetical protein [Streptomyces sp. ME18-1-4]